jgi:hypothetical protein
MTDTKFDLSDFSNYIIRSEDSMTAPERDALAQALSDLGLNFSERSEHAGNPVTNPNSFSQAVIDHLVSHGMFESQAQQVLSIVKERNEAMNDVWKKNTADYPNTMLQVIILDADRAAIEWIDENLPLAFFRQIFANRISKQNP